MSENIKLVWKAEDTPAELHSMLEILGEEYSISCSGRGLKLHMKKINAPGTAVKVKRSKGEVLIEYTSLAAAARGISNALSGLSGQEDTPFTTLGIMLDCSRNMVMKPEHFKKWLRRLALFGCNMAMLYTEETYELDDEPFFGYQRGAYSLEELQEIDDYAAKLGIEMIPCIQMLGHLEQLLKWPAYHEIRDTERVMMVDEPKVYKLIEKMLDFWSKAFRTRQIHIGFDETHDLGRGKYYDYGGRESAFTLFNRHLAKVNQLCNVKGYTNPMIWSDMYFRLSNPKKDYYLPCQIPVEVKREIPKNVKLVYWDYYHRQIEDYQTMIKRHRELGYEPVVATGIWTWYRLWCDHKQTFETLNAALAACRIEKSKEFIFTLWGDDGAYCDWDSAFAAISKASDLAYGVVDEAISAERFENICDSPYDVQVALGRIDDWIPDKNGKLIEIPAAALIWDDPLMGIVSENVKRINPDFDLQLADNYEELLCQVMPFIDNRNAGDIEHAVNILQLLIKKMELRQALRGAYDNGDRVALRQIALVNIPAVITAAKCFNQSFRRQWMNCAKPQGLEVIQQRNATLIARLEETAIRIKEYLSGEIEQIDELENTIPISSQYTEFTNRGIHRYRHTYSACCSILF